MAAHIFPKNLDLNKYAYSRTASQEQYILQKQKKETKPTRKNCSVRSTVKILARKFSVKDVTAISKPQIRKKLNDKIFQYNCSLKKCPLRVRVIFVMQEISIGLLESVGLKSAGSISSVFLLDRMKKTGCNKSKILDHGRLTENAPLISAICQKGKKQVLGL